MAGSTQSLQQINANINAAIVANGVARLQQIHAVNVNPVTSPGPINISPNNVGIIRGFLIRLTGGMTNSAGALATLTPLGLSNLLSNITFQDFSNVTRINTTGWHLNLLNSAKSNQGVFGGAYSPNVSVGYGNNWGLQTGNATIAASGNSAFSFFYYVPLSYTAKDLRGAVFAQLVGATAQLQLTLNPAPFTAAGDKTLSIYSGSAGAFNGAVNVTVYQDYIDQLPTYGQLGYTPPSGVSSGSPALPPVNMSTIYELINTSQSSLVAGQDFGIAYTNLRTFMSTSIIFDNGGSLNTGSDVNYFALTLANSANVWKYTPDVAALLARGVFMADPPAGVYYFDHRNAPINTQTYGNAQLVINASTVNAGAAILIGYEAFAMTQTIVAAPSVPS